MCLLESVWRKEGRGLNNNYTYKMTKYLGIKWDQINNY